MIHWFDNLTENNHLSVGETIWCFFISSMIISNIHLANIFTWESVIRSLIGLVVLVMTLGVNDLYKEYLKPKFIKFLKNGKAKRNKKRAA